MESLHGGGENCGGQEGSLETIFQTPPPPLCPVSTCACTPPPLSHRRGGYNSDDITRVGVGGGALSREAVMTE